MKVTASSLFAFLAAPVLMAAAQTGPGSAACDTCLAACKANPSGISQDCVTACNNNLNCNATITTSTIGTPTATIVPSPSNAATDSKVTYLPLSLLGVIGCAVGLL